MISREKKVKCARAVFFWWLVDGEAKDDGRDKNCTLARQSILRFTFLLLFSPSTFAKQLTAAVAVCIEYAESWYASRACRQVILGSDCEVESYALLYKGRVWSMV